MARARAAGDTAAAPDGPVARSVLWHPGHSARWAGSEFHSRPRSFSVLTLLTR